jgi:peptidoglycan/xylan/chitin deacetylase (PgdA/CDA1 family)
VATAEFAHGIMFHHFHDGGIHPKGQGSITADMFDRMIHWLRRHRRLLNAMDWYEAALRRQLTDNDVCLTFDDNLLCQSEIALPVLKQHAIQAFWFIYTSPLRGVRERLELYRYFRSTCFDNIDAFYQAFTAAVRESRYAAKVDEALAQFEVDSYLASFPFYTRADKVFRYSRDIALGVTAYNEVMDQMMASAGVDIDLVASKLWNGEAELRSLHESGHVLGLHSHTHPTHLSSLPFEQQLSEYGTNMQVLRAITGEKIFAMSHPCNSYNDDTFEVLRRLDVGFGFRANMDRGFDSHLEYPRLDHALLIGEI